MSAKWTNAEKRRLAEGLSRAGALSKPYEGHPFGKMQDSQGLYAFFTSGEFEPGKNFDRNKVAMDTQVSKMLRVDFSPHQNEVPDHVRFAGDGTINTGNHLVKWVYENRDLYLSDVDEESDEESDDNETLDGDDDQDQDQGVDENEDNQQDEGQGQGQGEVQGMNDVVFHLEEPSEEQIAIIQRYYDWITHREELPDVTFPWENPPNDQQGASDEQQQ